ncbi:EfeM/EfeO family lipoprotein [Actinoallomurus rhizosphaericola]|uniref:EfeM/EfeO family lipoprotein n=1 Tax=Actinoallomurus rhizosphaericola TaxID=2952536 RepID=UPI002091DE0C|nr:EfeM/EfeO family lipoprotein [Actinoallomurus rhizosphaericola]MCO5993436.1 EfeM/EfeO family lipoprotein [Actinoallomurus rhizosphaericola]
MRLPALAAGAALLLAMAGDGTRPAPKAPSAAPAIEAGASGCGTGRMPLRPGPQVLPLRNDGDTSTSVTLLDPRTGAVYAELEGMGPGTVRSLRITLGPGSYAFRCAQDGPADPVTGPVTRITGAGGGTPGIVPVSENDLYAPTRAYQTYVSTGLDRLVDRTDALRSAVDDGDLGAARAAWTPAHLAYERLGAAYGTFGDFDGRIDGLPAGLAGGVHDAGFTGFHRVEYGLWHGESAASLAGVTDRLARDVRALRSSWADERMEPGDLPLRAHEVLENTLQFQLTGEADQGSGTTLRTAAANLEGTRELVGLLRPLLRPRYAGLAGVDASMDRMDALLKGRSSVGALSRIDRERLNGAAGDLLERLAPIATICAPRRRPQGAG